MLTKRSMMSTRDKVNYNMYQRRQICTDRVVHVPEKADLYRQSGTCAREGRFVQTEWYMCQRR